MSMPIFFIWNGGNDYLAAHDALHQVGIGTLGKLKIQPLATCCVGVIYAESQQARIIADTLHPNLMTFPGPNGNLQDKHAKHIAKEFPKSKGGDGFRGILASVYGQLNDEHFNPDNF